MKRANEISSPEPIVFPRVYRGKRMSIISVTGGKGGVGKSGISANLAIALKELGGRVLLLDGDLGMANADQMLGVNINASLYDVVEGEVSLEDAIVKTPWGISLLGASSGRREMAEMKEFMRLQILESIKELSNDYDYIVIDTAAGIGGVSIDFASIADLVLAISTPDPASVRDVFAIMKVLSKEKNVSRINLVANMVSSNAEGVDLFKRISCVTARFLPLTLGLAGIVLKDPLFNRATRQRAPMVSIYPQATASRQISKLASHILTLERELKVGMNL